MVSVATLALEVVDGVHPSGASRGPANRDRSRVAVRYSRLLLAVLHHALLVGCAGWPRPLQRPVPRRSFFLVRASLASRRMGPPGGVQRVDRFRHRAARRLASARVWTGGVGLCRFGLDRGSRSAQRRRPTAKHTPVDGRGELLWSCVGRLFGSQEWGHTGSAGSRLASEGDLRSARRAVLLQWLLQGAERSVAQRLCDVLGFTRSLLVAFPHAIGMVASVVPSALRDYHAHLGTRLPGAGSLAADARSHADPGCHFPPRHTLHARSG